MAIFEAINATTLKTNLWKSDAQLTLGGSDEKVFAPNLNIAFHCSSGAEKYFINLNRKDILAITSKDLLSSAEKITTSDNQEFITLEKEFKWNIVIPSKPAKNYFDWEIIHSPGIVFNYQDSIENNWKKNNEGMTLEEYQKVHVRPENVVGSYAVYCDKNGNFPGVKYYHGKLTHIYRPLCIDAQGIESWGELLIQPPLFRVTIPQKYLDVATYPITLDPYLGDTSCATVNYVASGRMLLNGLWAMSEDGTATKMWVHTDGGTVTLGIYDSSGNLLKDTAGGNVASGVASQDLDSSLAMTNGTSYIVASGTGS